MLIYLIKILKILKIHENIILENLNKDINEKLIYSLFNIIDLDNKYIIVTSEYSNCKY